MDSEALRSENAENRALKWNCGYTDVKNGNIEVLTFRARFPGKLLDPSKREMIAWKRRPLSIRERELL